jgi:hypothetical protein
MKSQKPHQFRFKLAFPPSTAVETVRSSTERVSIKFSQGFKQILPTPYSETMSFLLAIFKAQLHRAGGSPAAIGRSVDVNPVKIEDDPPQSSKRSKSYEAKHNRGSLLNKALRDTPKGSQWTMWVAESVRQDFLKSKMEYMPCVTHSQFLYFLMLIKADQEGTEIPRIGVTSNTNSSDDNSIPFFPAWKEVKSELSWISENRKAAKSVNATPTMKTGQTGPSMNSWHNSPSPLDLRAYSPVSCRSPSPHSTTTHTGSFPTRHEPSKFAEYRSYSPVSHEGKDGTSMTYTPTKPEADSAVSLSSIDANLDLAHGLLALSNAATVVSVQPEPPRKRTKIDNVPYKRNDWINFAAELKDSQQSRIRSWGTDKPEGKGTKKYMPQLQWSPVKKEEITSMESLASPADHDRITLPPLKQSIPEMKTLMGFSNLLA